MKINYQQIMEGEIEKIRKLPQKPTLLLHVCCAPCSSAVIEVLEEFFDITIFFYNPNISPKSEFDYRLSELERFIKESNRTIKIIAPEYNGNEFREIAKGLEDVAEGGARCNLCYRQRIEKTVAYCKDGNFDYVTTTLTVSPYKNAQWLNEIGAELGEKYGVKYLQSDFKKKEGYKRSCRLSEEYNLYRQDYCGCVYSKKQKETV